VKLVVESEAPKTEPNAEQTTNISLDINDIIGKIGEFVGSIRELSSGSEPMSVNVEGFNVAVSKDKGEYEFALRLNLVIKPKPIVVVPGA
jgi:hypothetical protein